MKNSHDKSLILLLLLSILLLLIFTGLIHGYLWFPLDFCWSDNLLDISSDFVDVPETYYANPRGYHRYACKFAASHGCPNRVWMYDTPCAHCVSIGRE